MATIMPFGKHRGKALTEVPQAYLRWLQRRGCLSGRLGEAVEATLDGREYLDDAALDERVHAVVQDAAAQMAKYQRAGNDQALVHPDDGAAAQR